MSGWDMTRGTLVSRASKSSAIAGFLFLAAAVESIAIEPYSEYRKLMEPVQEISALRDDLFGDSVSLYNGATSFHVVDVALKGSNSLLVQAGRRFRVDLQMSGGLEFNSNLEGAGGWDIDVPPVNGGVQIGTVGRSGNTPALGDSHLHHERRIDSSSPRAAGGTVVDPLPYLPEP